MTLENRVYGVVAEAFGVPVDSVSDATEPTDIPQWDSLGHMSLITEIEKAFSVMFEIDKIMEAASVRAIVKILQAKGVCDD